MHNEEVKEYYRGLFENLIMSDNMEYDDTFLDEYIKILSFYICNANHAYKYNLPYLESQHKGFIDFLSFARRNYKRLSDIVEKLSHTDLIGHIEKINDDLLTGIKIYFNSFLEADLKSGIRICENFSIAGAKRDFKDDVLTISYKEEKRSIVLNSISGYNKVYNIVVEEIKELIGYNECEEKNRNDDN